MRIDEDQLNNIYVTGQCSLFDEKRLEYTNEFFVYNV